MFSAAPDARRNALTAALRAVRRRRRLTVKDAAAAMGIPRRSYQHFESGGGRLNWEAMLRFAESTNSDPIALFAAVMLADPALASLCADNKLATIFFLALEEFSAKVGDAGASIRLEPLVSGLRALFRTLGDPDAPRDDEAAHWLAEGQAHIEQRMRRFEEPPG